MYKTLGDCIGTKKLFEFDFLNNEGMVYRIELVVPRPLKLSFTERLIGVQKVDYGIAHCRFNSEVRYTLPLSEHLEDLANPSEEAIRASKERCRQMVEELGENSGHITL